MARFGTRPASLEMFPDANRFRFNRVGRLLPWSRADPPVPGETVPKLCLYFGISPAKPLLMAKADRLARLDDLRMELEGEYRALLIEALKRTAAGQWGLFDHQADRAARAAVAPTIEALCDIAAQIDKARDQLGLEEFALEKEFLASRGPVRADAVGEPKQARAWLQRLGETV